MPVVSAYASIESLSQEDAFALWANTGVLAPLNASAQVVSNLSQLSIMCVPAGMGWQDVAFRAVGMDIVLYNQILESIQTMTGEKDIILEYASGYSERVSGVILTIPPGAMMSIKGILPSVQILLKSSLVSVSIGVLYATWSAQDVWWTKAGFQNGFAQTDTELGRISIINATGVRFIVTGALLVNTWTSTFVQIGGMNQAMKLISDRLTAIFNTTIPNPQSVSYRSWKDGIWMWTADTDIDMAVSKCWRPMGNDVNVWWSSGDVSKNQGWVEGCIQQASTTVNDISKL